MKLSENGIELITGFEGCVLKITKDIGGKDHIGYGHLIKPGEKFTHSITGESGKITKEQAKEIFSQDIKIFEDAVNSTIKVPLSQNQFDVLVSFAYNTGPGRLKELVNNSNLNEGNYTLLPKILLKYITYSTEEGGVKVRKRSKGLLNRREKEAELWKSTDIEGKEETPDSDFIGSNVLMFLNRAIDQIKEMFSTASLEDENLVKQAKKEYLNAIKTLNSNSSTNKKLF